MIKSYKEFVGKINEGAITKDHSYDKTEISY